MAIHSTAPGAPPTSNVVDFAAARTLLRPVDPLEEALAGCNASIARLRASIAERTGEAVVTPTEIPTTRPGTNIVDLAAFRAQRYPLDPLQESVRSAQEQLERLDSYPPLLSGA